MLNFRETFETKILSNLNITEANCWECSGYLVKGYGEFSFKNKKIYAHRASYIYHYGKFSDSLHVLHKCDNPACVNPEHLFLGTHQDNMLDKMIKGKASMKLEEAQVLDIFLSLESSKEISKKYRVGINTVNKIRRGEQWEWLTKNLEQPKRFRESEGTYTDLTKIKEIYFSKKRICDLVKEFGLARQAIRHIKTKQSWKSYTDTLDKEIENVNI